MANDLCRASPLVALVGVGFGPYTIYVQRRDKRPRLKVTAREDTVVTTQMQGTLLLGMGMKRNDAGKPDGAGEPVVCLKLANTGEKTVSVVEVRMVQPSGAYMRLESMGAERPFPPVIEPGDSTRCWIGLGKVTDILRVGGGTGKVRLTFEVKDALGHIHKDEMVIRHRRVGSVLGLLLRASRSEVTRTRARLPPSPRG